MKGMPNLAAIRLGKKSLEAMEAKEVEVVEGNKLIAEFLNLPRKDIQLTYQYGRITEGRQFWYTDSGLRFHHDWSWLMPVLEQICRMKIGDGITYVEYATPRTFGMINDEDGKIMVRLNGFTLHQADTLIEATWLAVIDFIKWHNQEK